MGRSFIPRRGLTVAALSMQGGGGGGGVRGVVGKEGGRSFIPRRGLTVAALPMRVLIVSASSDRLSLMVSPRHVNILTTQFPQWRRLRVEVR